MQNVYLFTSERLGFRNWRETDLPVMAAINADPAVMEFFPSVKTFEETREFIERMQTQLAERDYCYFAVDLLASGEFIGFTGLCYQAYDASFTPCIDTGWRLCRKEWHKGYATEGARRCLNYGFEDLGIKRIVAVAPVVNRASERVMQKAGMQQVAEFIHPLLIHNERLKHCVLYERVNTAE